MIITLLKDSKKTTGIIKHLRFRLRDTGVDIKYRSDLQASVEDLQMFDASGRPSMKARFGNYNESLALAIEAFINQMMDAYNVIIEKGMPLTYDTLRAIIEEKKNDDKPCTGSWVDGYYYFVNMRYNKGYVAISSYRNYHQIAKTLERFAIINHIKEYHVKDITPSIIQKFYEFLQTEHLFVEKRKLLYKDMVHVPSKPRLRSTIAKHIACLKNFFNYTVELDIITSSPFDHIIKDERKEMLRREKNIPVFLRAQELLKVRDAVLPENLQLIRDVFYLQCLLGCRVSDFINISRDRICVNEEGIPFYRYVPIKTSGISHADVETPLLKSAVNILKKLKFQTPLSSSGRVKDNYNKDIKEIIRLAGIDRQVKVWDEVSRQNIMKPVYQFASNKMARKTFEDIMVKVQLNFYTTGLHAVGSGAIENYTRLELIDRYRMMCLAFDEPVVFYDDDLNEKNSADFSQASTK